MPGFLDIAAELRNRIYELSLTHDRANGRLANVNLLRVNKQINLEARKMLPDLVESFTIRVDGSWQDSKLVISGDMVNRHPNPVVFPAIMYRVPQVNIELRLCDVPYQIPSPRTKCARRFIIQLSRALDQANNEQGMLQIRLRVQSTNKGYGYDAFNEDVLRSLFAMGRKKVIKRVNF